MFGPIAPRQGQNALQCGAKCLPWAFCPASGSVLLLTSKLKQETTLKQETSEN